MSYEKVKCITRNEKENKIFITSACSNVTPQTYNRWEFMANSDDFHEKELALMKAINGGGLALNNGCYNWNYAYYKTREYMLKKYDNDYNLYSRASMKYTKYCLGKEISSGYIPITEAELNNDNYMLEWQSKNNETKIYCKKQEYLKEKERVTQVLEEYYNVFMGYLNEKHSGKYYLYNKKYGYIIPKGKNGSFYYDDDYNNLSLFFNEKYLMDYHKAYCMAKIIGINDIEIRKIPTRQHTPTQEQLKESKERIEIIGLDEKYSEKLYMSDMYGIKEVKTTDFELIDEINKFENEYNTYVYSIIYTNTNFGKLYTMLYVSNNNTEWQDDKDMLRQNESYAYVYNKTDKFNSEIGLIGFNRKDNLLIRVY